MCAHDSNSDERGVKLGCCNNKMRMIIIIMVQQERHVPGCHASVLECNKIFDIILDFSYLWMWSQRSYSYTRAPSKCVYSLSCFSMPKVDGVVVRKRLHLYQNIWWTKVFLLWKTKNLTLAYSSIKWKIFCGFVSFLEALTTTCIVSK